MEVLNAFANRGYIERNYVGYQLCDLLLQWRFLCIGNGYLLRVCRNHFSDNPNSRSMNEQGCCESCKTFMSRDELMPFGGASDDDRYLYDRDLWCINEEACNFSYEVGRGLIVGSANSSASSPHFISSWKRNSGW